GGAGGGRPPLRPSPLGDVRKGGEGGCQGVGGRPAEALAGAEGIGRVERLVAEDEDRVLEKRAMDLAPAGVVQAGERHPANLGAERSRERLDLHGASLPL